MNTIETTDGLASPSEAAHRVLARAGWVAAMVLATAAGSQVAIPLPFTPVPLTLQVFAVLLTGLLLGPVEALWAQAIYVGLGLCGVPWYAGLTALPLHAAVAAATFGYLAGFTVAAPVVALLRDHVGPARACGAGLAAIYLAGATHLAFAMDVDPSAAVTLGVFPFLPLDVIKAALAIRVASFLRRRRPSGLTHRGVL